MTLNTFPQITKTELPPAAALGDADANPTAPLVGAAGMLWTGSAWRRASAASAVADAIAGGQIGAFGVWVYNGTTWDRARGSVANGLLVDVSRIQGSVGVTGPLTDTQLRASAIPVSGPLTDTQLRASAVPVSISGSIAVTGPLTDSQLRASAISVLGPLTDAQLRASAVPVTFSGGIDTELPAAAALSDTDLNSTAIPSLGARAMIFDGTNWVRARGSIANGVLVDVSRIQGSVAITGALTDTQLRASAVPVSGPLTDTQLRASAISTDVSDRDARILGRVKLADEAGNLISGTNPLDVTGGSGGVIDTELPAAAALIDADSGAVPSVGSRAMVFNGTDWDRARGSIANGLLVDVSRVQGSVAVTGPLTDTQLRASALDISDRDARLLGRAKILNGAGTVIDPLTDTQLRASAVPISDGGGSLTVDGSITADTELPAAAVLTDAEANTTAVPQLAARGLLFNGSVWKRERTWGGLAGGVGDPAAAITPLWNGTSWQSPNAATIDAQAGDNVPAHGTMVYNGTNWDRARGDIANGLDVDVTRLPALPAGGNLIGSVDTELPAAAALGDAVGNPTTPMVGAGGMLWNSGLSNWQRARTSSDLMTTGVMATGPALFNDLANQWNAQRSAHSDALDKLRIAATGVMAYNGATYDRIRGDITNGLDVDVTRFPADQVTSGAITASGQSITASIPQGMASAAIAYWGTYAGITVNFEITWDGITWLPFDMSLGSSAFGSVVSTVSGATNLAQWLEAGLPRGITQIRVRCSAFTSGSMSVYIGLSPATTAATPTVNGTVQANTELPSAAALADGELNSIAVPEAGSRGLLFNGTTWDRYRSASNGMAGPGIAAMSPMIWDTGSSFNVWAAPASDVLGQSDIGAVAGMLYTGSAWVRPRGDVANGMDVDVTRLPSIPAGANTIGKVDQGVGGASAWKVDGSSVIQPVAGDVAAAAADSGNPIKIGGKYLVTKPTLADGQRGDAQLDTRGKLLVAVGGADSLNVLSVGNAMNGGTSEGSSTLAGVSAALRYRDDSQVSGSRLVPALGDQANGLDVDVTRVQGSVAVTGPLTDAQLRASAVPVSFSGAVDTELPAAAALADAELNSIAVPEVGSRILLFNGTDWDRARGDITNGLDVDVTRLPSLPAGNNNIGDVDVVTLPAIAALTDGTQKSINRGGAKGATTAADVTSTAEGADHQALDNQNYHGGVAIDPRDVSDRATREAGRARIWDGTDEATVIPRGTVPSASDKGLAVVPLNVSRPAYQVVTTEITGATTTGVKQILHLWHPATLAKDVFIIEIGANLRIVQTAGTYAWELQYSSAIGTGGTTATPQQLNNGDPASATEARIVQTGGGTAKGAVFQRASSPLPAAATPLDAGVDGVVIYRAKDLDDYSDAILLRNGQAEGLLVTQNILAALTTAPVFNLYARFIERA